MTPRSRPSRREVVAAGLLLAFCVGSILVLSRVLSAAFPRAAPSAAPAAGEVAKPPLYPPPEQLLDLPHFRFLLNADPCADEDVSGVLVVTSHVEHVELRSAHRRAYPRAELLRLGLRRVFLLARPGRPGRRAEDASWSDRALRDEGLRFSDIVQGDFVEAYRNLTYKHTMGLQWAARYCPQARHVIKMDDDIVVDLYQFVDFLNRQPALTSAVLGYVLRGLRPSREPANKWFVTRAEYGADAYPDFVSGWLYATTPGVARSLAEGAARWTSTTGRYFWIDDLLLTGMVRKGQRPAVALRDASSVFTVHPEVLHCCLAEPDLRCDVLVGPNGGENNLIVEFQAHAARCHSATRACRARPPARPVEKTCVVRGAQSDGRLAGLALQAVRRGQALQVRMF